MIRLIVAFLASVLTGVQTYLILSRGASFCLGGGCEIVESMTLVPPLYFNAAGFLFFQSIFWCVLWGRKGSEYWNKLAKLLLMAGLMAEAVLVFFQYSIAQTFCYYCLLVASCVVLLNILCGLKQIFRGIILTLAVLAACFSLQFNSAGSTAAPLEKGSIASMEGVPGRPALYLFFSAACPHCEAVIEALGEENECTIHFNPIEILDDFTFPEAKYHIDYEPLINLGFLKSLSHKEVPVLVAVGKENTQVLSGRNSILRYIDEQCRPDVAIGYSVGSNFSSVLDYTEPSSYLPLEDEGCSVEEDCEQPGAEYLPNK